THSGGLPEAAPPPPARCPCSFQRPEDTLVVGGRLLPRPRQVLHSPQPRAPVMASHDRSTDPAAAPQAGHAPGGRRDGALLVIVFTALLVLPPVGHHLIVKSDEARFALLARDMLERVAW